MSRPTLNKVLACQSIPTLPLVAMQLLELLSDPHVNLDDIEKLVQSDQGLATRVLRTVNSSFYGLTKPCSTIKRAVAYLGLNAVKSLALGFSLVDMTKAMGDADGFDMQGHWRRCICSATAARLFAETLRACDPDEAFTAAMFQDVGVLAIHSSIPEEYAEVIAAAGEDHESLHIEEDARLGFNHTTVGAALASKWKLPTELVECIRHHHSPMKPPKAVTSIVRVGALGRAAADVLSQRDAGRDLARVAQMAKMWFSQSLDLDQLMTRIAESTAELSSVLDQNIGSMPDVGELMEQANEQLASHQIAVQRELTSLRQEHEDLSRSAQTDGLTGIANRKAFDEQLESGFAAACKEQGAMTLLFCDADRFKSVNDTHGHHVGDAVLVELARRFVDAVGDSGTVCRYGGEEFAILLPLIDTDAAGEIAERMRAAVAGAPFDLKAVDDAPDELPITVSIGISATPAVDAANASQLVREADEGVYQAKNEGRNCVRRFGTPQQAAPAAPTTSAPAPLSPAAPEPVATLRPPRASGVRQVLLVEDDPLAATLLSTLISRKPNVEVVVVDGVGAAMELLNSAADEDLPNAIIADLNLRDGLGTSLVELIRGDARLRALAIVIVTASRNPADLDRCNAAGADAVFTKGHLNDDLPRWIQMFFTRWVNNQAA